MTKLPKKIKKSIILDIIVIVIFNLILLYIFSQIDFLERIYTYSQEYEEAELDEIIPLFISLTFSLVIFAIRRFIELTNLLHETELLSIRDHLTGLYNRRYIQGMFNAEVERTKRKSVPFSAIMIDIDDFKKINDTHGHNVGDKILSEVSEIILSVTRKVDVVSRWGGEEFLILCPETNLTEAKMAAHRLIEAINGYEFSKVSNATVSIGVVLYDKNENFESIVNRADECLYQAKKKGKNCYVSS